MKNNLNEKIINNVKQKISISNFIGEEKYDMKQNSKNILKSVGIAVCMIFCITGVVFAKDIGELISNVFGGNASDGVQTAVDNDYIEQVEPTFIKSEGIEITVNSFLIDDYNFDMNFKIKLSDTFSIKEMEDLNIPDLKIIDENNEFVFASMDVEVENAKNNHNAGIEDFEPLFWGGYSMYADKAGENELILHLTAHGTEEHKFPKSKKLYVSFSKLQKIKDYDNFYDTHKNPIYIGDWYFELDVPEEMYNRENIIYKMKYCSEEKIEVDDATLSNTAFKINVPKLVTDKVNYELLHISSPKNFSDKMALQNEYVETSDGKIFETAARSDGDSGYGLSGEKNTIINYHQTFSLTKYDTTDKLIVHIFTNKGEEITIEYERIK